MLHMIGHAIFGLFIGLVARAVMPGRQHMGLILTMILGGVFLGVKAFEWKEKFDEHHVPGPSFHLEGGAVQGPGQGQAMLFFSLHFAMTGLHALHMIVGVALLSYILRRAIQNEYSAAYWTPVDISGLYWHFVDIVWVFIFPLLYLVKRV